MKTPVVPSCSTTGKTKSHLRSNLTAKDRAGKYATDTFHMDDGLMICSSCNIVIDHLRKCVVKRATSCDSLSMPGPDKISIRVIKDSLPVILRPLTDIINNSFAASTFPEAWKTTEVIPLLKDGDHEVPANNRPLSLLTVASKVCERIALQQFNSYLQRHNLLNSHQSGNKKHHSTETLNILVTDALLDAMDNKMVSALLLLDLSKAFDSISHPILLQKFDRIGASDKVVDWFKSYLTDRKEFVRIGSATSSSLNITHPRTTRCYPFAFAILHLSKRSAIGH